MQKQRTVEDFPRPPDTTEAIGKSRGRMSRV